MYFHSKYCSIYYVVKVITMKNKNRVGHTVATIQTGLLLKSLLHSFQSHRFSQPITRALKGRDIISAWPAFFKYNPQRFK